MNGIPRMVYEQAQSMANATQQPHHIVRERGAWLVTPETHELAALTVLPQAPQRKYGIAI